MSEMYLKVVWKVGWCAERFLVFKYASMHACKYASMHISKQVCKYAIIQVCNLRGGVTKKNGKIWEKFPKGGGDSQFQFRNFGLEQIDPSFFPFS